MSSARTSHPSAFAVNAGYAAISVAALMPASYVVSRMAPFPCSTSMEQLGRGFGIAAAIVLITAPFAFRHAGLSSPEIVVSVLGQLVLVAFFEIALPNLDIGMADRSRQKRTMADMRTIADAIEAYRKRTGTLPQARSVTALQAITGRRLPVNDGWGHPFVVSTAPDAYTVLSLGACGERDAVQSRGAVSARGDLILRNGRFITYVSGYE